MGEAAINLAFLGATTYLVGRDVVSYLPSLPKTSGKRLRGEPTATVSMDDEVCDPATLPPRISHGPRLAPATRRAVKACCESLLEQKYVDERVTGVVPAATTGAGRVTCLNDIGQGTSHNNRIGNKILNKYLEIQGTILLPDTSPSDVYRLIVVWDRECFGSICTWGQYTQGTPSSQVYSLPSGQTVGKNMRFTTLVDKSFTCNRGDAPASGASVPVQVFSLTIPLHRTTTYDGNAGTISDIIGNSLCCIEVSRGGAVSVEWQSRIFYLDG